MGMFQSLVDEDDGYLEEGSCAEGPQVVEFPGNLVSLVQKGTEYVSRPECRRRSPSL